MCRISPLNLCLALAWGIAPAQAAIISPSTPAPAGSIPTALARRSARTRSSPGAWEETLKQDDGRVRFCQATYISKNAAQSAIAVLLLGRIGRVPSLGMVLRRRKARIGTVDLSVTSKGELNHY